MNDSELLVARTDGLYSVSVTLKREVQLFDYSGSYGPLVWSPDRQRYAFSLLQGQDWFLVVATREHQSIVDFQVSGAIESLDWLSADRLLTTFLREGTYAIVAFTLDGNELLLVDSWADDATARALER